HQARVPPPPFAQGTAPDRESLDDLLTVRDENEGGQAEGGNRRGLVYARERRSDHDQGSSGRRPAQSTQCPGPVGRAPGKQGRGAREEQEEQEHRRDRAAEVGAADGHLLTGDGLDDERKRRTEQ